MFPGESASELVDQAGTLSEQPGAILALRTPNKTKEPGKVSELYLATGATGGPLMSWGS